MLKVLVPVGIDTDLSIYHKIPTLIKSRKNVEFTLYHVVEIPFVTTLEAADELVKTRKYLEGKKKVEEARKVFEGLGLKVNEKIDFGRDTVETIVNEAVSGGYDLVILVKRRKIPRFLGKSVSKAVMSRATTPILILCSE